MMISGCGGGPSQDQLAQARQEGAAEASKAAEAEKAKAEQKKLAADVAAAAKAAKDAAEAAKAAADGRNPGSGGGTGPAVNSGGGGGSKSCGGNISVNSATSCPFAANVVSDWRSNGGGSTSFWSYSPVTGKGYWMRCTAGIPTVCRGGNNAVVYIR